jgi:hypothetical protein
VISIKLRNQAERVRWWAASTPDPRDRERLEVIARDYEEMARVAAERDGTHIPLTRLMALY